MSSTTGLCGFRHAAIKDAHNALLDIQLGGRSKELIAQVPIPQLQVKEIRLSIWGHCNLTWVQQAVLRIRDVYPDPNFCHPGSTNKKGRSKNIK